MTFTEFILLLIGTIAVRQIWKQKEVLIKLGNNTVIYIRDSQFTTKDGMLNIHPNRRTHWNL